MAAAFDKAGFEATVDVHMSDVLSGQAVLELDGFNVVWLPVAASLMVMYWVLAKVGRNLVLFNDIATREQVQSIL